MSTEVRRSLLHHHRSNGEQIEDVDADSSNNFDNPFDQPVRGHKDTYVGTKTRSYTPATLSQRRAKVGAKYQNRPTIIQREFEPWESLWTGCRGLFRSVCGLGTRLLSFEGVATGSLRRMWAL